MIINYIFLEKYKDKIWGNYLYVYNILGIGFRFRKIEIVF